MSDIKLKAASGGGSISLKGPSSLGSDRDLVDTSGNINLLDSQNLKVGTDADLKIWHDGSNGYISNNTGAFVIQDSHAGANAIIIRKGAEVELLHNEVLACETSANGLAFPSGKGIDFSATSDATGMTSELFDDYEEGLHTCTASPQNGTVTLLSGQNTLAYTKVGRIVHVGGTVKVDSVSNPSGDMQLSMPFTVNDLTEEAGRTAGASFVHNSTDGNNDQVWAAWINEGTNDIWLRMPGTSGSANKVQANTEFFISISYPT